jgi:fibronectin-binding autotransporter adhesin
MNSKRISLVAATIAASLTGIASAATLQWGTAFDANGNQTAGYTGNWSDANWTLRSGTDLGVAGIPDAGDVAQIGLTNANITIAVNGTYSLLRLDVRPRSSGFAGRNVTINSSSGVLQVGANGLLFDNGGLVAVNVPITLTADQTWSGGTNNPGAIANFGTTVTGNFKITRTSNNTSVFSFFAGNSTFGGLRQSSANAHTRVGNNSSGSAAGGGPLGSGLIELAAGTLSTNGSGAQTINNAVRIEGNVNFGQPAGTSVGQGGTGTLTFGTAWAGSSFTLYSTTDDATRTITTIAPAVINHTIGESGGGTGLGLTKAGASTLTLNGNTTYTGDTSVSAGTLTVNGTLGNANINVTGGTLNGTGNITYNLDGNVSDLINLTGGVFNLAQLDLIVDATGTQTLSEYVIVNAPIGSPLISGTEFQTVSGLPVGASIDYDGTSSNPNAIVLVIPEPASLGLLSLGLAALRRRR